MKTKIPNDPLSDGIVGRVGRAAIRLGLRKAGALLRASAPLAIQAAGKLEVLSEHPDLKHPPSGSRV